ncbi:MAG: hypothetical protein Q9163_000892 [Psora crenata]
MRSYVALTSGSKSQYFNDSDVGPRQPSRAIERLPQINYSLLNDNALRKKLGALGIPNSGPRSLLMRRHTEWVNLVNANCDSKKPRTKRELLHELEIWDKAQGRQFINGSSTASSSVMKKDFDGAAWASDHNNDFKKLIAEAKKKAKSKQSDQNTDGETPEARFGDGSPG